MWQFSSRYIAGTVVVSQNNTEIRLFVSMFAFKIFWGLRRVHLTIIYSNEVIKNVITTQTHTRAGAHANKHEDSKMNNKPYCLV